MGRNFLSAQHQIVAVCATSLCPLFLHFLFCTSFWLIQLDPFICRCFIYHVSCLIRPYPPFPRVDPMCAARLSSKTAGVASRSDTQVEVTPDILWADRKDTILVTIDVQGLKQPTIDLTATTLTFRGSARDRIDDKVYQFKASIDFFAPIVRDESRWAVTGRGVLFHLKKKDVKKAWSGLYPDRRKRGNVKVDWKYFYDSDDDKPVSAEPSLAGLDWSSLAAPELKTGGLGDMTGIGDMSGLAGIPALGEDATLTSLGETPGQAPAQEPGKDETADPASKSAS